MEQEADFKTNMGEEIVRTLEGFGFELTGEHTLQYYFYLPDREGAERLAESLSRESFTCEIDESAGGANDWICLARHVTSIESDALTALGKRFASMAEELGGEFDGWERAPEPGDTLPPALAMMSGIQLYQQGDFAEAVAMFNQVVESEGDLAEQVIPLIGLSYLRLGEHALAVAALKKAIAAEPENAEHHLNIGVAWHGLEDYESAIESYDVAMKLDPEHPSPHYNLACAYAKMGNTDAAISSVTAAIARAPEFREQAAIDEDLTSLRELPAFQKLVSGNS